MKYFYISDEIKTIEDLTNALFDFIDNEIIPKLREAIKQRQL